MAGIRQIKVGHMENFAYLVADEVAKEALLVDPGWDAPILLKALEQEGWQLKAIALTHNHFDHVNATADILRAHDIPIYTHGADAGGLAASWRSSLRDVAEPGKCRIGTVEIGFLHTPGHTPGSMCLSVAGNLITGDTLFIGGCGRVDLPGSDPQQMYETLRRIAGLDGSLCVLPGHDYGSTVTATLASEKHANPYLKFATSGTLGQFLHAVG